MALAVVYQREVARVEAEPARVRLAGCRARGHMLLEQVNGRAEIPMLRQATARAVRRPLVPPELADAGIVLGARSPRDVESPLDV